MIAIDQPPCSRTDKAGAGLPNQVKLRDKPHHSTFSYTFDELPPQDRNPLKTALTVSAGQVLLIRLPSKEADPWP